MVDRRTVQLEFADPAHFLREYQSHFLKGGIFVRIEEAFQLREPVDVEVVLLFRGESVVLSGEVVGLVSKALSASGEPGIAVQLHETAVELDLRFQKYFPAPPKKAISKPSAEPVAPPVRTPPRADLPVDADQQRVMPRAALGRAIELKKMPYVVPREVVRAPNRVDDLRDPNRREVVSTGMSHIEVAGLRGDAALDAKAKKRAKSLPSIEQDLADFDLEESVSDTHGAQAKREGGALLASSPSDEDSFSFQRKFSMGDLPSESLSPEVEFETQDGALRAAETGEKTQLFSPEATSCTASPPSPSLTPSDESIEPALDAKLGNADADMAEESACDAADRRIAPRAPVHLAGQMESTSGVQTVLSQNISDSGVLVSVDGEAIPVGDPVRMVLHHPVTGDELMLTGSVARHQESDGSVVALAIRFEIPETRRAEAARFVEDVQAAEHAQSLAGIHGLIAEMGAPKVVQMFSVTVSEGTLRFKRTDEEGTIVFRAGILRWASVGSISGRKAFWRLMNWDSGQFEFRGQGIETPEAEEAPLMLQDAILQGVTQIADLKHLDLTEFPPSAKLTLKKKFPKQMSSIETAIVELVRTNSTVRRVLDVIPDPDIEIYRALVHLKERDVIHILQRH